jgi:hypothetical protein
LWLITGTTEGLQQTSENIWIQLPQGNWRGFLPEMQQVYKEKRIGGSVPLYGNERKMSGLLHAPAVFILRKKGIGTTKRFG